MRWVELRLIGPGVPEALSPADALYRRENAPGDAPYWRGAVWMNVRGLSFRSLRCIEHARPATAPRASRLAPRPITLGVAFT